MSSPGMRMPAVTRYTTIPGPVSGEVSDRGSRFLCTLAPADSEAAARELVDAQRRAYHDARHHCFAYILGADAELTRSSDDGEPSGTAGAPMLEVLRGRGLSDVVAVVTRWFGGTLLGAGGLVRAYGDAVRAAADVAVPRERVLHRRYLLEVDHADAGRIEHSLRMAGCDLLGATYDDRVRLEVGVPADDPIDLRAMLGGVPIKRADGYWV